MKPSNSIIMSALANNTNQTSQIVWAFDIVRFSIQAVVTGTPTGTLQVWVSNDKAVGFPANQFVPTNWVELGSDVSVAAAGVFMVPSSTELEASYEYIKLVYTDGSGGAATGTISANLKAMAL